MKKNTYAYVQQHFGRKVRERRKQLNMTQQMLALLSDLHWTYISQVERGLRNISLINIAKIAEALNSSMKELLKEL